MHLGYYHNIIIIPIRVPVQSSSNNHLGLSSWSLNNFASCHGYHTGMLYCSYNETQKQNPTICKIPQQVCAPSIIAINIDNSLILMCVLSIVYNYLDPRLAGIDPMWNISEIISGQQ